MIAINEDLRRALLEVFKPTEVDQALAKIGAEGSVRDLRNELEFDSLDEIEFILALEQVFGIEISDDEASNLLGAAPDNGGKGKLMSTDLTIAQLQENLEVKRTQA